MPSLPSASLPFIFVCLSPLVRALLPAPFTKLAPHPEIPLSTSSLPLRQSVAILPPGGPCQCEFASSLGYRLPACLPAAMAGSPHGACTLAMLLLGLLFAASGAESTVIEVGGKTGWTTGFDYEAWVVSQNIQLHVGDSLVFRNPDSLTHTVGLLNTTDEYQRCVLGGVYNVTPVPQGSNITIVIPGTLEGLTLYAVCTIPGHCTDNQKIEGLVLAAETTPPAPAPPPPPGTPTPKSSDADMNRFICWTTAILLIAACFWNLG